MPFADVGELRIRYQLAGPENGPVVAFSNSLGTNLSMWEPQFAALGQRFRVLGYDMRGQGQSSVTGDDYSIEQLARDFLGLLNALGLERVNFCGLSMGGMVGMWLAVNASDRLHRLVVCNSAARIGTKEMWNARIASVRQGGMKAITAGVLERWLTADFREKSPIAVARVQRMLEESPVDGYAGCCAAIRDMDQRQSIAAIGIPTLVIAGAKDPVIPAADARFVSERISGAQYLELDAAHLSNIEQAEAFTAGVAGFVAARGEAHG
jgi:3-oxoadipate enol-lactonase